MKFSELKKIASPLVNQVYVDLGFKQKKGARSHEKKPNPYCVQALSYIESGQLQDRYAVTPVLWVVQRLPTVVFEKITGESVQDANIFRNFLNLTKETPLMGWEFYEGYDFEGIVADFRDKIVRYAIPYLDEYTDLRHFLKRYMDCYWANGYFLIPAIHYILGESEKGLAFIEEHMEEVMTLKKGNFPPWVPPTVKYDIYMKLFKDYVRDRPFRMGDYESNV